MFCRQKEIQNCTHTNAHCHRKPKLSQSHPLQTYTDTHTYQNTILITTDISISSNYETNCVEFFYFGSAKEKCDFFHQISKEDFLIQFLIIDKFTVEIETG